MNLDFYDYNSSEAAGSFGMVWDSFWFGFVAWSSYAIGWTCGWWSLTVLRDLLGSFGILCDLSLYLNPWWSFGMVWDSFWFGIASWSNFAIGWNCGSWSFGMLWDALRILCDLSLHHNPSWSLIILWYPSGCFGILFDLNLHLDPIFTIYRNCRR